jgi:hypothetical protein
LNLQIKLSFYWVDKNIKNRRMKQMAGKRIRGLAETTTMANTDYVILDNSVLSESKKISKVNLLKEIQAEVDGKQASLGYTAENIANKSTDIETDGISDIKYPSAKATKDYVDTKDDLKMNLDGSNSSVDKLSFDITPSTDALTVGQLRYNVDDDTLDLKHNDGVTQQIGTEIYANVVNKTGVQITEGKAVYPLGKLGKRQKIALAKGDAEATSNVLGITTHVLDNNENGKVTTFGEVNGIKTNYAGWVEGDIIYLSKDTAGELTNIEPVAPCHCDIIGIVGIIHPTDGSLFVNIQRHMDLTALSDVNGTPLDTSGQIPVWDNTLKVFDFTDNINNKIPKTQNALVKEPTGFKNPELVVVTGDGTARTVVLSGTVEAYWQGEIVPSLINGYISPAHGITITDTYYLSYNGTTVAWNNTVWTFDQLQIAIARYDSVAGAWKYYRECHGLMNWQSHKEFHETIGTYLQSGGTIPSASYTLNSTTATNRRPNIDATVIADEDLQSSLVALTSKSYTHFKLTGAGDEVETVANAEILPVLVNNPYYNQFNATWGQTLMPANSVATVWIYAQPMAADTRSQSYRYLFVQPQWVTLASNSSAGAITSAVASEKTRLPSELNLNGIITAEIVAIAKIVIVYTAGNWVLREVTQLTGNKFSQVGSPSGNFLSTVAVDGVTITGNGTTGSPLVATGSGLVSVTDNNYYQTLQDNIDLGNLSDGIVQTAMVSVTGTGVKNGINLTNPISFKDSGARVEVEGLSLTNKIINGNFASGTTGYTTQNQTLSATGGVLTGTLTNTLSRLFTNSAILANHKYYFMFDGFTFSDISKIILFSLTSGTDAGTFVETLASLSNSSKKQSFVVSPTTNANGWRFVTNVTDILTTLTYTFSKIIAVNLTAHYGAGNEPTASQMDAVAPTWFNGTMNVVNPLVKTVGKNFLDLSASAWVQGTLGGGGSEVSNTVRIRSGYIRVLPLATFILSRLAGYKTTAVWFYDSKLVGLTQADFSQSVIIPSDAAYVRLTIAKTDDSTIVPAEAINSKTQLELGSTATTYEAYKSNSLSYTGTLRSVRDYVSANQLITNGNFVNTTGWTASNTSFSVASNEATLLATAQLGAISHPVSIIIGHVYYIVGQIKSDSTAVNFSLTDNISLEIAKPSNGTGVYQTIAFLYTAVNTTSIAQIKVRDSRASGWTTINAKNIMSFDLTVAGIANYAVEQIGSDTPYYEGSGSLLLNSSSRDRLYNSYGKWYVDRYVNPANGLLQTMATENATVSGAPFVYRNGTTSIETATIAPQTEWNIPYADEYNTFVPVITWVTATPTITSSIFKYLNRGKRCSYKGTVIISDGKGATNYTISIPIPVLVGSGNTQIFIQQKVGTTYTNLACEVVESTNLITVRTLQTLTNGVACSIGFSIEYEGA